MAGQHVRLFPKLDSCLLRRGFTPWSEDSELFSAVSGCTCTVVACSIGGPLFHACRADSNPQFGQSNVLSRFARRLIYHRMQETRELFKEEGRAVHVQEGRAILKQDPPEGRTVLKQGPPEGNAKMYLAMLWTIRYSLSR